MIPAFRLFVDQTHFYATLFHELIHWTGHASRLDRFHYLVERFDIFAEEAEELVAELGAAFLCAEFSIDGHVPRAATYVERFLKLLTGDPRAIFTAASKAQEAVDYLRQRLLADPEERPPARCRRPMARLRSAWPSPGRRSRVRTRTSSIGTSRAKILTSSTPIARSTLR
jgi:antirestriction protein ArdC